MIEEDKELVRSYFELGDEDAGNVARMSPWLLRIELNREMMVDKKLSIANIAQKITDEFGDELHVVFSDDNAEKLVLRVRLSSQITRGGLKWPHTSCNQNILQRRIFDVRCAADPHHE